MGGERKLSNHQRKVGTSSDVVAALRRRQGAELEVAESKVDPKASLGLTRMDGIRIEDIRGTVHVLQMKPD